MKPVVLDPWIYLDILENLEYARGLGLALGNWQLYHTESGIYYPLVIFQQIIYN